MWLLVYFGFIDSAQPKQEPPKDKDDFDDFDDLRSDEEDVVYVYEYVDDSKQPLKIYRRFSCRLSYKP